MLWFAALLALVIALMILALGYRSGRLLRTVMVGVLASFATLLAAIALELTGWKDVDGWIDCHGCHGWHWFGALLFLTPLFLTPVLALAALLIRMSRFARTRSAH